METRKTEDRIDCSVCLFRKNCEYRGYCMFSIIDHGQEFSLPSIFDLSKDHTPRKGIIFIKPMKNYNPDNFGQPF